MYIGAVGIEHAHTVSQYRSLLRSGSGAQNQPSASKDPIIRYLVEFGGIVIVVQVWGKYIMVIGYLDP